MEEKECPNCRKKYSPRDLKEKKGLINRLNRIIGQLGGIAKMIDEDRYCGDVIIQLEATQKATRQIELALLKGHMEGCVKDQILEGKDGVIEETMGLIENLR